MHKVRSAAVAGAFYPAQPQTLTQDVLALLAVSKAPADAPSPKALIVPHAGYIYSGATAALAYGRLFRLCDSIRRVVLLGPVHRVPVRGLALPDSDFFATPLGEIEIDQQARAAIAALPQVVVSAAAHAQEHSLEVHLPFLQTVLKDFKLMPLAVGDASAAEVAQVLEALWGGEETLIVISSDLSHFLPYAQAQAIDRQTAQQVMSFQSVITHQQACGATPVNGLLLAAQRHGLRPELLGLCNSGDSAGDKARVVGYASFAFVEPSVGELLLPIARAAIARALGLSAQASEDATCLQQPGACFVTLTQRGQLRGCIGSLEARRSLLADVKANAVAAAMQDPRFAPLTQGELAMTRVEVSVLSPLQEMHFASEADALAQLRPGIDGLVFSCGRNRSTFLPQVWEQLPSAREFMAQLKRKAGLAADFWDPTVRLQRYSVAKWQEATPS
jgi:AmmeMemoRadiSam system protein B/AmmeMemoRadiSam system protein A